MRIGSYSLVDARRRRGGFTFAEVLAAILFMAILIPVVVEGLTLSNRAAVAAERKSVASRLAENQLNEYVMNRGWEGSVFTGDFGEEWSLYQWRITAQDWAEDDMLELTIEVFYEVQGRESGVRLSTLVDDSGEE
jgi:type II secretory pathway pseudopilin PulG